MLEEPMDSPELLLQNATVPDEIDAVLAFRMTPMQEAANNPILPPSPSSAAPTAKPKRTRVVICRRCGHGGHYQKNCTAEEADFVPFIARQKAPPKAPQIEPTAVIAPQAMVDADFDDSNATGVQSDSDDKELHLDPVVREHIEAMRALALNERRDGEVATAPQLNPLVSPVVAADLPWDDRANWKEVEIEDTPIVNTRGGATPISPVPRTFKKLKGSINIPNGVRDPPQFFQLLFDDAILQTFCSNTNSYVQHQAKPVWSDSEEVTVECGVT